MSILAIQLGCSLVGQITAMFAGGLSGGLAAALPTALPGSRLMVDTQPIDPSIVSNASMRALDFLNAYGPVFLVAFLSTLLATPIVRRVALSLEIIDKPDQTRKLHRFPIAYLGGFAVFIGVTAAIITSLFIDKGPAGLFEHVPLAVVIGILAITFTGLADDAYGWDPRLKIAGQLVAAAALAVNDIGVHVAEGVLVPFLGAPHETLVTLGSMAIPNGELYYWVGTALIAVFVLGGCNATNLIDGLDGLLSGSVAIMMIGFLIVSLMMATARPIDDVTDSLAGARIVICLATLGAVLGFLPWNFNPAVIFLGDCGSLLLGYLSVVVILMFGEGGNTPMVIAGLIIFALPIMDTCLAIVRRKLAGKPWSAPDSDHIHHQLKRGLGGVKRAVFTLYGITAAFAAVGVGVAAIKTYTSVRVFAAYTVAIVLFGFVTAIAIKIARRQQWDMASHGVTEGLRTDPVHRPSVPASASPESARVAKAGTSTPASTGPESQPSVDARR
jgi:UDP-GlcNAc:undecaprenyl-phosphate/decaprenyl-phosphate GlcNAc-1-phosphate transferase